MPLQTLSPFSRMAGAITRALGETITFETAGGDLTFRAKFRMDRMAMDAVEGVGSMGDVADITLATTDAVQLVEGDTFSHSGMTFRLAGARSDSGRGLSGFDVERTS